MWLFRHWNPRVTHQATGSLGYALIYPIAVPAGRFRAQPIPDAGNSQDAHLGAGGGKSVVGT